MEIENYPAFDYVSNYAISNDYSGNYLKGWYMPTISEMWSLYENKGILNSVLKAIGGNPLKESYWSSSQFDNCDFVAWFLNLESGYVFDYSSKDSLHNVCCVRPFE